MQKVKVQRYVSGKIPEYARNISSGEDSGDDDFFEYRKSKKDKKDDQAIQETVKERFVIKFNNFP